MTDEYFAGKGCTCAAYSESECCCNVDWTPAEVYELQDCVNVALQAEEEANLLVSSIAGRFGLNPDNYQTWELLEDALHRSIDELHSKLKTANRDIVSENFIRFCFDKYRLDLNGLLSEWKTIEGISIKGDVNECLNV